ncbi:hypothetical protein [Vitiosangium sp. GDMCC 1.1324]|uniref:hypothetical protein n=1 Tax=Vitiosangium sp. (strain GDMCC 1.1324) TaxID=2138576 RepID=UPI000D331DFC|nr:hypothetical protein [Vitiosangium sp. GDMCC 1.1324]PTL79003.1 hypothetical protein DAT35_35880 [Vitiosangium sp. GDMCC 1.1324]
MPFAFVSCDTPHFAPKAELVDITYRIPEDVEATWVELQIRDNRNNLVFTDRARPDRTRFRWDGSIRPEGTEPRTRWVNPLASPFTVQVLIHQTEDGAPPGSSFRRNTKRTGVVVSCKEREQPRAVPQATSATLKVLYHGLQVVLCPWTLEYLCSSTLDQDELSSLLLNERGYYAGPPLQAGGRQEFQRALRRFKFNNRGVPALSTAPVDSSRDPDRSRTIMEAPALFTPISKASGEPLKPGRPLPTMGSGGGPLRLRSEAIGFDADYRNDTDEFAAQLGLSGPLRNKWDFEAEKLNRPLLPLLARITLKGKDGGPVDVPEAVGPAKVRWSVEEPDLDNTTLALEPGQHSRPKVFVSGLLEGLKKHQGSMNCPEECGGVRTEKPALDVFVLGTAFPGFNARPDPKADGAVYTIASFDLSRPLVRGQAGIFFQPSNIAGDQYRLTAELDFEGAPAARDHGTLSFQTEVIQIWRSVKLSAVVGWPQRGGYQEILSRVADEYRHAFIELDLSRTGYLAIEDFFRQEEYSKWLQHYFSIHDMPAEDSRRAVLHSKFSPDAVFRPAPGLNLEGKSYFVMVMTTILHEAVVSKGKSPSIRFLADLILERLHRTEADFRVGIVLLDYLLPQEVFDIRDTIGFGDATLSVGLNALFALTDQVVKGSPYHIFAHEIGHCFWLCHHENAGDKNPKDHDPLDHGCIMSYPKDGGKYAHQRPDSFLPHFCGKCLFKLRGWNIHSQRFAEAVEQADKDSLKVVVYYDAAEQELQGNVEAGIVEQHLKPWSFGERVLIQSVDRDISKKTQQWKKDLSDCDVYHHVSHGNIYHEGLKVRVYTLELFTPKYPLGVGDPSNVSGMEYDLYSSDRSLGPEWYRDVSGSLLRPMEQLSGVIQWASTGYKESSSGDVMFGRDIVSSLPAAPRRLALLSCCLVGWNPNLAKAFLDRGTEHVIAFRARYLSGHAVPFSRVFYSAWSRMELTSSGLQAAFVEAAEQFPHAEPVLFSKEQIIRVWATKRDITHPSEEVKVELLDWSPKSLEAFMTPHFHDLPSD